MKYRKCEICGLKTKRNDGLKRFFMARFPLDEARCKQWVKFTAKEDLAYVPIEKLHENKFICGKHFSDRDFNKKKTQLKKHAVPSMRPSAPLLSDEILAEFPYHVHAALQPVLQASFEDQGNLIPVTGNTFEVSNVCETPEVGMTVEIPATESICDNQSESEPNQDPQKKNIDLRSKNKNKCVLAISPRKRKLVKRLNKHKLLLKQFRKKVKLLDEIKSPALKFFLQGSIKNQGRNPHGRRWSNEMKGLILSIYKKSPRVYRYLKQLMPLPSERTLQAILQKIQMEPGWNELVLSYLKKRANKMSDKEKTCVILFDEMSLKKRLIYNPLSDKVEGFKDLGNHDRTNDIADKTLVFMLQGIYKKLKQPLAHFFVKGTISTEKLTVLIKEAVQKVSEAGFHVLATVCDQGPTNVGALNLLKKLSVPNVEENAFVVNGRKICIIYDVPHLFKNIRNNFMQAEKLRYGGKIARWSHLREVVKKNTNTLHFKKITPLHVDPSYRSKMKVKLAAQILRNTVKAILLLMADTYNSGTRIEMERKRWHAKT